MTFSSLFDLIKGLIMKYVVDRPVRRVEVCREELCCPRLPEEFDGMRILHLSDLHAKDYGKNSRRLAALCEKLAPDVIAFTGDVFSRNDCGELLAARYELLKRLTRTAPVYYVIGNHEGDVPAKTDIFCRELTAAGVNVLRNSCAKLCRDGAAINICGLELPQDCYVMPEGGYSRLRKLTVGDIEQRLGKSAAGEFTLLLAHSPLQFKQYAEWGADVTLSGHIHGGVVRLFGVGLLSPERKFFPKYTKGVYSLPSEALHGGRALMEVSAGLGKFRINNPESVTVCTLRTRRQ